MNANSEDTSERDWLLINAIRQAFGIGRKQTITYAESIAHALDLAPVLISPDNPLVEAFEAELVRFYKERAEARSRIDHKAIKPLDMLDTDIRELENEAREAKDGRSQTIESEIRRLRRAREKMDQSNWTESLAISRDADSYGLVLPISDKGQGYKEYKISQARRLRVRVLHPDPPEAKTGVDLIYESYYDQGTGRKKITLVRIAALQYKMWDGNNLYTSQAPNLLPQIEKMHNTFCEEGFCNTPSSSISKREPYRLPNCCVFLRPTDKRQTKAAWQVTHAWHLPICRALEKLESTSSGHKVLRSNIISNCSVTQSSFQELYNRGMLGSRWINSTKLNSLYKRVGIFDNLDTIIVHSQEY